MKRPTKVCPCALLLPVSSSRLVDWITAVLSRALKATAVGATCTVTNNEKGSLFAGSAGSSQTNGDVETGVKLALTIGARYAIWGGMAVVAHGEPRFKQDMDILLSPQRFAATRPRLHGFPEPAIPA